MTMTDTDDNEPILEWCEDCNRPDEMCGCDRTPNATVTAVPRQERTEPEPNAEHAPEPAGTEHRTGIEHTAPVTANTDRTDEDKPSAEDTENGPGFWREWGLLLPIWFLAGLLGAAGFASSFFTVEEKMRPYFSWAWLVPAGTDLGIIVFTLLDIVLARRGQRIPWMRYIPWALTAATIYLNVTAYTVFEAQVAHAVMPSLWIVFSEAIARIMREKAEEEEPTSKQVPLIRWVCAPVATLILWRAMKLWKIATYDEALEREEERQLAKAIMRAEFGSIRKAPCELQVRYRQRKISVAMVYTAAAKRPPRSSETKSAPAENRVPANGGARRSAPAASSDRRSVRQAPSTPDRSRTERPKGVRTAATGEGANTSSRTDTDERSADEKLGEALAAFANEGVPNPSVRALAERAGVAISTAHKFKTDLRNKDAA